MALYERETIINFNEDEAEARVYTFNVALQNSLRKLAEARPEECRLDPDERLTVGGAAAFIVPKKWVKVRPPRQDNLTDEQRNERREHMRAFRARQLGQAD